MKTLRFTVGYAVAPLAALGLLCAPLPPAAAQAGGGNVQAAAAAVAQGDALAKSGDFGGAVAAFQQALAADPQYALAQQRLADMYPFAGGDDKAIAAYRFLLSPPPGQTWDATANVPASLGRCAVLLVRAGQGPEALSMYERAAGLLNQSVGKAKGLEVALPDLGDGVSAPPPALPTLEAMAHLATAVSGPSYDESELRWALGRDYTSPVIFFYLGKCQYLAGGHAQEAKDDMKIAVAFGTDQKDDQTVQAANAYLKRMP